MNCASSAARHAFDLLRRVSLPVFTFPLLALLVSASPAPDGTSAAERQTQPSHVPARASGVEGGGEGKRPLPSITIREPLGVARTNWPVTTGVPFPRGRVSDAGAITLQQGGGTSVPLQTRLLSRWDDGSVRWLLADFPVTIGANGQQAFEVVASPHTAPNLRVQVQERPEGIAVDTGPLQFMVPRNRFAVADDVRLHGRPVLAGPVRAFLVTDDPRDGKAPATLVPSPAGTPPLSSDTNARAPRSLTVRESGPVRAEIECRGQLGESFDYAVRVHAYAGQSFVRVLFTFVANGPAPFSPVRQLAVQAALPAANAASYRVGVENQSPISGALPGPGLTLLQNDNLGFRLNDTRHRGHAAGWIEAYGPRGGIAVAARFFWQEYPKSFTLQPGMLTYNLWAPEAQPAQIGVGAAKTHEFALLFYDHAPPGELSAALAQPLVAAVDPTWVAQSHALPNAVAPDRTASEFLRRLDDAHMRVEARTAHEVWDEAARVTCSPAGKEWPRVGAYGMLNWGDWNYPGMHDDTKGCDAWGNLEYDLTQVEALAYAATGKWAYYDAMTAAARHFMDVDVIHAQPRQPKLIGMNHPKNPLHFSFERGGVDLGHTWTEGVLSYYYLTGDARALEVARGIADYLVRRLDATVVFGNPRQWGWPQIALLAVHYATGEARYTTAALGYARRGIATFPPSPVDHWKLGILADALADTHAVTHDPALEQWLRTYAATVAAKRDGDHRLYPAVAYVAALAGDPRLARTAHGVVEKLQFGNWAKPFTITGRSGFRILSLLQVDSSPPRAEGQTPRE